MASRSSTGHQNGWEWTREADGWKQPQKKRKAYKQPDRPDLSYLETMIDTREKNPDLEQPPEWIEAREKVLRNVMEVCKTVCQKVVQVGSGFRGTNLPYSDIDLVCLFDQDNRHANHAGRVEKALQKLSDSIDRRDDYFDEDDDFEGGAVCLNGSWWCNGEVHQIEGRFITWADGEVSIFEQDPGGVVCGSEVARLRGTSLIWPTETWVRKTFSNQHIARKWPDPPPKPMHKTTRKVSDLRYASDTISDIFSDGKSLFGLVNDITTGGIDLLSHPKMILDCVEVPSRQMGFGGDMQLYCLNNRRLYCIKKSSAMLGKPLSVRVKIYRFSDCAGFWQSRITTVNGGCRVAIRSMQRDGDLPPGGAGGMPESMSMMRSKRKSEYLHLIVDGFYVDVLASSTPTLHGQRLADALLAEPFGQRNVWAAVCAVEQNRLKYLPQEAQAVRLAKLWTWYVAFPYWDYKLRPRSYLIEILVRHVCVSQTFSGWSWSAWDMFVGFLELCARKRIPSIMFQWASLSQHAKVKWGRGPKIIDPINPTNNVAKPFRAWGLLRKYANISLQKIKRFQKHEVPSNHPKPSFQTWGSWSDDDEELKDIPDLWPENPTEVRRILGKLHLPELAVEKLLDEGFTSLEALCRVGRESDFHEAGMNKVQARRLAEALGADGCIFVKLKSEGRLCQSTSSSSTDNAAQRAQNAEATQGPSEGYPGSSNTPNMDGPLIPLMCYPAEAAAKGRCLLFGTLVRVFPGGYQPVERLIAHRDFLESADGSLLTVQSLKVHDSEWWLVQLEAAGASLTVTDSHRIVCVEGALTIDKLAGDLNAGDVVRTTLGDFELSRVESHYEAAKVVELELSPDEAFEAFHPPTASILSKGSKGQAHGSSTSQPATARRTRFTRRGGQNLRNATAEANRGAGLEKAYSHVDTASDW